MPEMLQKEIEHHLATFPDFKEDFIEMKKEWEEFKTRAFWTLISFTVSILAIGVWVGTMQSQHSSLTSEVEKQEAHSAAADARINSLEINNGEIRSRLTSIDLALQDIKLSIKELR